MIRARSKFRIPGALFATLTVLALSACGGGGGGGGSGGGGGGGGPPPVAVASVVFASSDAIAIQGMQRSFHVMVKGDDGSTLTDRTIAWESSNTSIGTVAGNGQAGVFDALATGSTNVTATVEGKSASVKVEVKPLPADLAAFKALFPFQDTANSPFVVASEISDSFNAQQREHLIKAWNHFSAFFPAAPGAYTEMYYTWDTPPVDSANLSALLSYAKATFPECNSTLATLPGRQLLTCSEPATTTVTWLVAPYRADDGSIPPDQATTLASVSQSFMDAIKTGGVETYTWPWLWEGLSYAFKSGTFDTVGAYTMHKLADPEASRFRQALASGSLLPIGELVALARNSRYAPPNGGTWYAQPSVSTGEAQSAMLMNYLYVNHPSVVQSVFAAAHAGTVMDSQQAFAHVLNGIGLSAEELDAAYKAYGANP